MHFVQNRVYTLYIQFRRSYNYFCNNKTHKGINHILKETKCDRNAMTSLCIYERRNKRKVERHIALFV